MSGPLLHTITIHREIDAAHRVVGHPGKCRYLHGHRWQFDVVMAAADLDETGFVCDFGVVKGIIDRWDHRLLLWSDDPITIIQDTPAIAEYADEADLGVIRVPANPTSENLGMLLCKALYSDLDPERARLAIMVTVHETPGTSSRWGYE